MPARKLQSNAVRKSKKRQEKESTTGWSRCSKAVAEAKPAPKPAPAAQPGPAAQAQDYIVKKARPDKSRIIGSREWSMDLSKQAAVISE